MRAQQFLHLGVTGILILVLAGCQAEARPSSPTLSETQINSLSVEPEDIRSPSEDRDELEDAALYDPLAIVRELGEAVDSPNITHSDNSDKADVQPKTDLATIDETIWEKLLIVFR